MRLNGTKMYCRTSVSDVLIIFWDISYVTWLCVYFDVHSYTLGRDVAVVEGMRVRRDVASFLTARLKKREGFEGEKVTRIAIKYVLGLFQRAKLMSTDIISRQFSSSVPFRCTFSSLFSSFILIYVLHRSIPLFLIRITYGICPKR
jgi:hypothetical protein